MYDSIILKTAKALHEVWKEEKLEDDYHLPRLCPTYEKKDENEESLIESDLIHCNKCLANLCEFEELNDFQKHSYLAKAEKIINYLKSSGVIFGS